MTIGTRYRNDASGNDSATVYPYQFKVFAATDLRVIVRQVSSGIETVLTYPTHYSVSNVGNKNGGNVTLVDVDGAWQNAVDGTLKTGYDIAIRRQVSVEQDTDIRNQGSFHADTHEDEFDYLTMIDQQQEDKLARALLLGESYDPTDFDLTLPAPDAGLCLAWNATEDGLVNVASPGALTVSGFASTLLDDANAEAFLSTLIDGLPAEASPASGDKVVIDDISEGAYNSSTLADLLKEVFTSWALSGDISPAQIAANTNNWNPASLSTSSVIRFSTDASRNFTGLSGGADGRVILAFNVGSFPAVFTREDANSTAANRFAFASDITVQPGQALHLWYDSTSARWRRLGGASKPSTVTVLTSGSGTYTTPTGATRLRVRLVGAGSGGNSYAGTYGGTGGNTTFGSVTGNGGQAGGTSHTNGNAGGSASGGDVNINGGAGQSSGNVGASTGPAGGNGAASPFGGSGRGGDTNVNSAGGAGQAGGGGGGSANTGGGSSSGGGGAGGYSEKTFTNPSATYSYGVGAAGAATGSGGNASGAGGSGLIIIEEFYD